MAVDPAINEAVALAELYRDQAATSSQLAEAAKDDANAYTGEAATNASLALTRANLALAAQQAAEASESAVNAIFATVQDVYLGSSATALTQRPDASALQVGDIYWDTNTSQLLFWDSVAWVTPDAAATTAAVNASASAASATSSAASAALSAATATVDADTAVQKAGEASADAAAALTYRNQAAGYITSVTTFYDMAETSANNSYTYSVASQNFSDLAYKWAEEDPYTEVNPGEYSARHYAYLASQTVAGVDTTIGNFTDAYSDDLGAVNAAINTANITIGGNKAIYDAYVTTNDAAVSTVKNRLDAYDLLNLDGRTTSVEDTLDILNVNSVIQTVVDFPAVKDDLEEGREYTLSQLMEIYKAKKNARLELAFAQQSLATDINDARKAAAQYRLDLAAAIDANSAQITQLNYVSADSKSALARMVAAMQVKAYGNEAAILNESLLRADEFGVLARTIEAQLTAFGLQQEDNYDPTRTYYEGQGVVYLGIGYLATESVVGENPDTSAKWIPITDLNLANWIADTYDIDQQYLQGLIDGKIDTYYGSDDPSTDWTVEEKVENTGDFWFVEQLNAQTGETTRSLFRYDGASWQVINDDAAITAAALAQQTADGKVSTYIGSTADRNDLTGMSNGDIFIVNDVDGEGNPTNVYWIYVESALEWQEVTDGRVPAATADILDIKQNQIGYCTDTNGNIFDAGGLITNKTTMDDWVTANPGADELPLTWNEGLPFGKIFEAIKINTTANTGSIEQLFKIYETAIGDIEGEITFKLDINGRVGGFGYSGSSANQGTLFSVVADKFTVAAPADFTVDSTSPPASPTDGDVWYQPDTGVTQRYNGSDWAAFDPTPPFTVLTTEQTYEGRTVPAGVYISKAAIGQLDANQINVSQLAAESIFVSKYREAAINASSPNLAIGSTTGANWTGSFTASSYTHSKENSSTTVAEFLLSDYLDALTAGSEYTLSFLGRKDSNVTGLNIHVLSDTGGVTVLNLANLTTEVTTSYKYFAYTFTVPNDLAGLTDVRIRFTNPSVTSGTGKIFVRNVQLELGPYDTLFRIPAADTVTAIVSAATTADWASVDSRPTTLSELNTTDGSKLAGIPADADKTDYTDSRIANSEVTLDGLGGEASGTAASLVDAIVIPTENLVDTSMLEGVGASGIYGGYNYTRSKSVPSNTNWRIQGWTKNLSDSPTAAQVHGDYVVSFWIKTDSATATDITFDLCDTGNFTVSATSTWQYVSKVFTNVTSVHLTSIYYGFFDIYSAAARTITIANMFIGYGNQIVDWKPSVKDASSPGFYKITSWADIATVPTAENFRAAFGKYPIDRDVLLLEDTSTPVKQKIYVYEASSSTFSEQVGYFAGDVLVEGTVTADKIAANAITADRLSVGVNADIDKGTTALQIGDISEIISEGNLPTGETTYTVSGDKTITFSGNNVTSSGGTDNSWSGSFYSDIGYSSACAISFKIGSANFGLIRYMIGLNTDPTTNNSYGSIDYTWYINTTITTLYSAGSNVVPQNGGNFSVAIGDTLSLVYDGISKIYCYHNATLKHTFTGVSASKFYLDSSFYDNITTEVDDVRFAPIQNIDYGSIGGVTIAPNKLYHGAGNFNSSDTGFYLDSTGQFSLKNNLSFDGTDLTVQGKVNAADFVVTGNTTGVSANTVKEGGVTAASLSTDAIEFIDNRILNFIGATASTTYPAVDLLTNYSAPFGAMGSGVAEYLTLGLGTAIAATHGIQDIELSASVQLNWSHTGYSGTGNLTITLQRADNSSFTTNLVDIKSSVAPISFYYFNGYLYYTEAAVTAQIAANALTTGQDYYYRLKVVSDVNVQSNSSGDCYISLYEAAGVESTGGDAATYGSLTITGDLTVNGTTTTLNTATLDVEDKNITLNYGAGDTSASADGAGITIQDAVDSANNATLLWDATNDEWDFSHHVTATNFDLRKNVITTSGNGVFDVSKTLLGNIHITNGNGSNGAPKEAAITFQGSDASQSQAGIYVVNDQSSGTHMAFATTDSYATGPQKAITITNSGIVNFPRSRPTYAGSGLWAASDFSSTTISNWNTAYGWGDHEGLYLPIGGGTLTSTLIVSNGGELRMQAGSNEDTGDLVWANFDGSERHRVWDGGVNKLNYRYNTGTGFNSGQLWSSLDFANNSSNWNTAYGWGDHASAGYLTSLPSHNHDDRYYTESEIDTFINRSYVSAHSAGNLAIGWYTIATNTGDRASARFGIWDVNSSDHQSVTFYATHHYGNDTSNTLTVLDNSYYSGNPFRYIRIKDAGTYDGAALQIYIDDATNSVNCAILGDNFQSSGWVLCDWIPDATEPPNVSNYGSFGERSKVDLNTIAQGGFATTGQIYAGGDTTQYRVFHQDYHPNADKWTSERTLSLTGDVTGSVSWDGSDNASIATTVADDSHTHDGRYYTETEADTRFVNVTGDTMTGVLTLKEDQNGGIDIAGNKIRTVGDGMTITSDGIRFGAKDSGWDYDQWAGLKYDHSNKVILFGGARASTSYWENNAGNTNDTEIDFVGVTNLKHNGTTIIDSSRNLYPNQVFATYYKAIVLTGSGIGSSYDERVVLLTPMVETNTSWYNIVDGKITALKTGGNVCDTFDVFCHSVYNDTRATFTSRGQRAGHKLVTCTYDGIKWIAIKFSFTANPYNYFLFQGQAYTTVTGNNGNQLKVISYYDTQNSGTVLNSEIYNSIADYNGNSIEHKTLAGGHYFYDKVGTTEYAAIDSTGIKIGTVGGMKQSLKGEFGIGSGAVGIHFNTSGGNILPYNYGADNWSNGSVDFGHPSYKYWRGYFSGDVDTGGMKVNGTTVIDSSRNLTNIGTIDSGKITVGTDSSRSPVHIKSNAWSEVHFSVKGTEYVRIGGADVSASHNTEEGDFFVYDTQTGSMNLIVKRNGEVRSRSGFQVGTTTVIDSSRDMYPNVIDMSSGDAQGYKFHGRSFSWNSAMQSPTTKMPHIWQEDWSGWDPVIGVKTQNGFWQMGAYTNDYFHIGYMSGAYGTHGTNSFDKSIAITPSELRVGDVGTMSIVASGDVTAFSDRRLKSNIETLDGSKVLQMRGVSFIKDDKLGSGVIAQELEEVAPELVLTGENGIKSVAYGNLVGYLIEGLKEQQKEIDELKSLVKQLLEK